MEPNQPLPTPNISNTSIGQIPQVQPQVVTTGEQPKSGGNKMLMIVVIVIVLLVLLAGAGYLVMTNPQLNPLSSKSTTPTEQTGNEFKGLEEETSNDEGIKSLDEEFKQTDQEYQKL